ncbi:MAG TPA: SagB family peptide dehydrogenase [Actinophytocola sp.]|jgi:SagB-type dehydrogenase family enzyme|uniref:SagB family peptide dehydrogenase n=1 Tax=Actinophytocola sp. TaxID=1872138 RepID=UPI002F9491E7
MPTDDGPYPPTRIHLRSLTEDVLVETTESGRLRVLTRWGELVLDEVSAAVRAALERLSMGPTAVHNIEPAGAGDRAELARIVGSLGGSVVHTLDVDDGHGPLASVVPLTEHASFRLAEVDADRPLRLSRFVSVRVGHGGLVLESAVGPFQVVLHRTLACQVVVALGWPTSIAGLAGELGVAPGLVADLAAYLVAAGVVQVGEGAATEPVPSIVGDRRPASGVVFGEDIEPALSRWTHHELMFHARTRVGRDHTASGRPAGDREPPPVTRSAPAGPRFPLFRPDEAELSRNDPALTRLIETERVCPEPSDRPLDARQLGELLYRAARVRSVTPADGTTHATSSRPYLSIADRYELELYLSIDRCAGLPRGSYHYDPAAHALTLVNDSAADLDALLDDAKAVAGHAEQPATLITVTARAERLLWLMRGTGYSVALMHLGALQQTLDLVATATGLAACPLALDTSDTTNRALRLDWPAEVGIGECIVGHR